MIDASSIPKPGQVYGVWNTPWKWRHIGHVYADEKAGAWILYGDDELGGGMLPLDMWSEWERSAERSMHRVREMIVEAGKEPTQ